MLKGFPDFLPPDAEHRAQNADTVGYDDARFDESPLAKETAAYLGRTLSRCRITPEEYFEIVPWVMKNMEQPLGDASAIAFSIALYIIFQCMDRSLSRSGITR